MKWFLLAALPCMAFPAAAQRAVIRSDADVASRYVLDAMPSAAFAGDTFLRATVPAMRTDAERLLSDADIRDPSLVRRLRLGLAAVAVLQDRSRDALSLIQLQRQAESKLQLQQVEALLLEAAAVGRDGSSRDCVRAAVVVGARLGAGDPSVIRDEVLRRYSDVQTASVAYYAAAAGEMVDPEAKARGSIGLVDGLWMAVWRVIAHDFAPCRSALAPVFLEWIGNAAHRPVDIWSTREPAPTLFAGVRPVTVAIWDSGFDATLFPGQRANDPAEPPDGIDNDHNGVIDDTHGPTFDAHMRPSPAEIQPLSPFLAGRLGLQMALEKGQLDLNFGDDTADAAFFAARGRDAGPAEQLDDTRASREFLDHSHGTWVASVVANGVPFVRLYNVLAEPWGYDPGPASSVADSYLRWGVALPGIGARLRGAGVRIVNMSWMMDGSPLRDELLETGAEKEPARAVARAAALFDPQRRALRQLIRDCPEILFIAAAGNGDQPDEIQSSSPQGFDEPNLLVVGAAGANGRPTSFTTYGPHVRLYARGDAVTVRAPGGMVMKAYGTSLASPFAVRAAAEVLALRPDLKPEAVIGLLLATATPGENRLRLLHAAAAVERARSVPYAPASRTFGVGQGVP